MILAIVLTFVSFTVSAAAGLGGSLLLVPTLSLLLGPKEGIALAALLLAGNNVAKLVAYRRNIPWQSSSAVLILTVVGAVLGASILVVVPAAIVAGGTVVSIGLTYLFEHSGKDKSRSGIASILAFGAGATSGFSGTSGPLKGIALRALGLDRQRLVGAASIVSFFGDLAKVLVFSHAALLHSTSFFYGIAAVPFMPLATWLGYRFNKDIGEQRYALLFWFVMVGYSTRLILSI